MTSPQNIETWLYDKALPLWSQAGIDPATGTSWEALDHSGRPLRGIERRLRVQLRQSACFAKLGKTALARQLFDWVMGNGFDPETGNLAARLSPDMRILDAPHDLYDLAFAGYAAAALTQADQDVTEDLARIDAAITRLKAPVGWFENAARQLPRRQNPHMHLFEMATELCHATGHQRFLQIAEECLDLFRTRFLQTDGRVLEFFDADLEPLPPSRQKIEPGHMAEWIFLLDRYNQVTGQDSGVDLPLVWTAVSARRDQTGLLPDESDPTSNTRRLWPQTELLKAACVMHSKGELPREDVMRILNALWSEYLDTPVSGGWYDKRTSQGTLLSDNMPASTFYHIVGAFRMFDDCNAAQV